MPNRRRLGSRHCAPEGLESRVLLADTVQLLQDINAASDTHHSDPDKLVEVNGTIFFSGIDSDAGRELLATDGTVSGTRVVKDINPGVAPSNPVGLTKVNGTLFFFADDGVHGQELW